MTKNRLLLLLPLLLALHVTGQQHIIDSIEKELKTNIPDSVRALSMMRIAINYESIDTAKAGKAYKNVIAFSVNKKLYLLAGRSYDNQSILLINRGLYAMARHSLDSAMYYLDNSGHPDALFRKSSVYNGLANVARYENDYQKSIEYQLINAGILEKMDKPAQLLTCYLNIANFYKEMNEFQKQEVYSKKALAIAIRTGRKEYYFKSYMFIVLALNMQNEYEKAKPYLDSSKAYYSESESYEVLVAYHLIAGLLYMNLNQLDAAKEAFSKSLAIAETNKAVFSIHQSRMQIGRVLTMQKKFGEAEPLLLSVRDDVKATNEAAQLNVIYDYLSRLYEEWGNHKEALKYHKEFKAISDSVSSERNKQYASGLEVKYETGKKESRIGQLEAEQKIQELSIRQKNIINYILVGSAITLLIIFLLSYRTYRQKQKLQQRRIAELEKEKQLAATESLLKGEEQERTRLARDLHDGLGGMLSGIKYSFQIMKGNLIMTPANQQDFERSMDMLDSSIKEMRRVAHNMMPEALVKFGLDTALKDFCNDINQSGALQVSYQSIGLENADIEQTTAITIYRIVQELINNTMKHAAAKSAIVQVGKTKDNIISITVEDDGRGFDPAIVQETAKGIGWSNIQSRVRYLKGKIDVRSEAGKGTSVLIELNG
jgi:two-component system NarL family sensor kinase